MTKQAREQAEKYVRESLASQGRLGYSTQIDGKIYEGAVKDAARAVDKLMKVQRRSRAAA